MIDTWSTTNPSTNVHEDRWNTFWDIQVTDKQTDKHTARWKQNLLAQVEIKKLPIVHLFGIVILM